jgi:hypothetical protein
MTVRWDLGENARGHGEMERERTDLLELLDGTLVDTTALVDEMAGL